MNDPSAGPNSGQRLDPLAEPGPPQNLDEQVWAAVEGRRAAYIDLLRDLVRASEGGEPSTQQFVADQMRALGCEVERIRYQPRDLPTEHEWVAAELVDKTERVAAVGVLRGSGQGRSILFWAHPDSAPVTDVAAWKHAPFGGASCADRGSRGPGDQPAHLVYPSRRRG